MLLEGFFGADELSSLQSRQLSPVVHGEHQLRLLEADSVPLPASVWIKLDTGMHRIGFAPEMLTGVLARLRKLGGIRELRVLTHLANADDVSDPRTRKQIESFHAKVNGLGLEISLANPPASPPGRRVTPIGCGPASCFMAPRRCWQDRRRT